MKYFIVPAMIAENQKELNKELSIAAKFSSRIQIDVMDGKFVPTHSNDFNFKLKKFPYYEAHLMIEEPLSWIKKHGKKVNCIIIHYESTKQIKNCIKEIKRIKKEAGIAINPETPISKIKEFLSEIDRVQIMTVYPGYYGAKFLPWTLKKVNQIRKISPNINIEVDGGINDRTILQALHAGANIFGAGSFVMKNNNPKKAYITLLTRLKKS